MEELYNLQTKSYELSDNIDTIRECISKVQCFSYSTEKLVLELRKELLFLEIELAKVNDEIEKKMEENGIETIHTSEYTSISIV